MRARTLAVATTAALTAVLAAAGIGAPAAVAAPLGLPGDFNGDGYPDLAVGVPSAQVGDQAKAGYVNVVWGGPDGPGTYGSVRISQATSGVPGTPEAGDFFGSAVAAADVDGDRYADLVVGASSESLSSDTYAEQGTVTVLRGSASGLADGGYTVARGDTELSRVGRVIAAGDVNGDGRTDLALTRDADEHGGAVLRPGPLTADSPDTLTGEIAGADLGRVNALATGDFDGDGDDDLALSASATETRFTRVYRWQDGAPAQLWSATASAASLASADFDADGTDDLALGSCNPNYEADTPDCADYSTGRAEAFKGGLVRVAYGSKADGFGARTQDIHQDTQGIAGTAESEDRLGAAVAAGDIDGDGHADLAIGDSYEAVGSQQNAGMVVAVRGTATGLLSSSGTAMSLGFTQNTAGVPGTAEWGDRFGASVRLQDYDADGHADLAAGAPGENSAKGGVWLLPGAAQGPTATGSPALTPRSLGLPSSTSALEYGLVIGRG
ncbi:FG-GAP and VCBS repeat-containing protein [Streptomyces sporangiiformans]|uniref:VCBS repeat-containing protein n=1 Tax=Streptomyces sporangiiformans TaxID=2315329 RepID=A0A505DDY9_9ACTN|nr:FG-GAP and VCBS repeat-containing protein [Streptomyces sporangiiformans]TPQ20682.1 VCBS repeat-containing protein [Streptomyces sporangiiformans]